MRYIFSFLSAAVVLMTSCGNEFISDRDFAKVVKEDFMSRSEILSASGIDLVQMGLTADETQALEFLYAYMPLGDIVNQSPEY